MSRTRRRRRSSRSTPLIQKDHHLIEFITDCLRMIVSGNMGPNELEPLLDLELETHHHESQAAAHALTRVSDSLPGFGIVAGGARHRHHHGFDRWRHRRGRCPCGGGAGRHLPRHPAGLWFSSARWRWAIEGQAHADGKAFEAVKDGADRQPARLQPEHRGGIRPQDAEFPICGRASPQLETHLKGAK